MDLTIFFVAASFLLLAFSACKYLKNAANLITELKKNHNNVWEEIGKPDIFSILTFKPSIHNASDFSKQKSFLSWLGSEKFHGLSPEMKKIAATTRKTFYLTMISAVLFLFLIILTVLVSITG